MNAVLITPNVCLPAHASLVPSVYPIQKPSRSLEWDSHMPEEPTPGLPILAMVQPIEDRAFGGCKCLPPHLAQTSLVFLTVNLDIAFSRFDLLQDNPYSGKIAFVGSLAPLVDVEFPRVCQ